MAEKVTYLTKEGLKQRESELEELKRKRMDFAKKIEEARGHGDLSENADYDAAKNDQADNESRIVKLETILKNVILIDESDVDTEVVSLGLKVILYDMEFNEEREYYLVGSTEANPMKNKISNESPVGYAIMGHKKGDIVEVSTPDGYVQYRIVDIHK